MQRHRAASRLTSWVFVAALLLKGAVPMLASAAAALQGRATAEVCDVYGVDTSGLGARLPATATDFPVHAHHHGDAQHAGHAHHADGEGSTPASQQPPAHGPASRVAHGGDHCALSALAFALGAEPPSVAALPAEVRALQASIAPTLPPVDRSARWAAQLLHAPPASS
ncbi:MAG TPA: hypothetical protein VLD35_18975 [Caldimonas sp.]|nr:hypothetical protein [Caldimonas sp.]